MCRGSLLCCASTNNLMTLHAHRHASSHPQKAFPNSNSFYVTIAHRSNERYSQELGDAPAKRGKGLIDGAGLLEPVSSGKAGLVALTACA